MVLPLSSSMNRSRTKRFFFCRTFVTSVYWCIAEIDEISVSHISLFAGVDRSVVDVILYSVVSLVTCTERCKVKASFSSFTCVYRCKVKASFPFVASMHRCKSQPKVLGIHVLANLGGRILDLYIQHDVYWIL